MAQYRFSSLDESICRIYGALDFDDRPDGLGIRRLPAWTRSQVPEGLAVMARMPSGVRVQIETDATEVVLEALTTSLRWVDGKSPNIPFQMQIGQALQTQHMSRGNLIKPNSSNPQGYEIVRGEPDTVKFTDLPSGNKFCEIWLPHNAYVALRTISLNEGASFHPLGEEPRKRWIHYGSSISHCMEANVPSEIWPAVAARKADLCLMNLGVGGQCHLDQFVARTIREQEADLISIKVGINIINMNSMKERVFTPALHGFLDTIRERKPSTPILLISPIYCPSAETMPGPTIPDENGKFQTRPRATADGSMSLIRVRELIEQVVSIRKEEGDQNLSYFSGLELFNETDKDDLPDDLHPNPAGYIRMGERFNSKFLTSFLAA